MTTRPAALAAALLALSAGAHAARAQDSVATAAGGNDALAAFDPAVQRVRYAVDLAPLTTSWNNPILIGPVAKASRDVDPMFRTQVLGSIALSPTLGQNLAFASRSYARWTTPGQGVHPTANAAPAGSVSLTGLRVHFGLGLSDFSLAASSAVGCVVGRDDTNFNRLYVERVVGVSSRASSAAPDTATVSLGAAGPLGDLALRADAFNTSTSTATRVLGDNILRVSTAARGGGVSTLQSSGGVNTASDAAASTYVVSNEATPTNTPSLQPGATPTTLVYDFASRFRVGTAVPTFAHVPAGASGHRGNPSYSPVAFFGSAGGTVASTAMGSPPGVANKLLAFGLTAGPSPTISGVPTLYTLPSPISVPGSTANGTGTAAFTQYLSQTGFRGGNGQVGIGSLASGGTALAATATDSAAGPFIAVVSVNNQTQAWTIAAHPGMAVRSAQGGASIGTLKTAGVTISAPAVDRWGNVYFVASWQPPLQPEQVGVFRAVNTNPGFPAGGYELELLLTTGQQIPGLNSGRPYTISSLTLADQDSIASGTLFSGSILQDLDPRTRPARSTSIRTFGGLAVSAVITYDNAGTPEAYDAVLFVGPGEGLECQADHNGVNGVELTDIFAFLNDWFGGNLRADFNRNGAVDLADIFAFLSAWFSGC